MSHLMLGHLGFGPVLSPGMRTAVQASYTARSAAGQPTTPDWFSATAQALERGAGTFASTYSSQAKLRQEQAAGRAAARLSSAAVAAEQEKSRRTVTILVGVGVVAVLGAAAFAVLRRRRR